MTETTPTWEAESTTDAGIDNAASEARRGVEGGRPPSVSMGTPTWEAESTTHPGTDNAASEARRGVEGGRPPSVTRGTPAPNPGTRAILDGNEAAASVAYRCNELCSIYPITPSSTMAELADEWSAQRQPNIWGIVPVVIEMQSEAGAAGAMHGALQAGAMSTTFTASQGLLLMIPNMYKIAGELTSTVFHVAARALAAQGLSIFGDHQDVMAVRQTGFALLSSASVQEAHDFALVAQVATMESRVPFLHFFDGFRTSHELNTLHLLSDDDIRSLITNDLVREHRARALTPEHPFIRGTAQNPDTYFQAREAANRYYAETPGIVADVMDRFAALTGRRYGLVEYAGAPDADRVLVIMGSGGQTARATSAHLNALGHKTGVLQVRLYRPWPADAFLAALPPTATKIAVLDRTKEPGANGEPLFLDVAATVGEACARGRLGRLPVVIGGRYGLSSKEFTPGMVAAVFAELDRPEPRSVGQNHVPTEERRIGRSPDARCCARMSDTNTTSSVGISSRPTPLGRNSVLTHAPRPRFTVGITDDVTGLSLDYDATLDIEDPATVRAVFHGLGSDGTVGANKNTIKILGTTLPAGQDQPLFAQGYFVYDSKKSGSRTVSHLRFGPDPIESPYLVSRADFIGVHHWSILERIDVLAAARPGTTLLLNAPYGPDEVFAKLPVPLQRKIIDFGIELYTIDALEVARAAGLGRRTNTVLQTCFFAISGVLPRQAAVQAVKDAITKTYGRKSAQIVEKNHTAVDHALAHLHEVVVPRETSGDHGFIPPVPDSAPPFVRDVTATMLLDRGDELPVSKLPVDGSYPSGTTQYEKRNVSDIVAVWDPETCIQCGNCAFVCPHAVLRAKYYSTEALATAPASFRHAPLNAAGVPGGSYTLQVYAEDCTGCGLCYEACPVRPPRGGTRRAINLEPMPEQAAVRQAVGFFEGLAQNDRSRLDFATVRGSQFLEPLFEFSGACAGCGETPYLKLVSQLFGDRAIVANATGCSSIYGGNLPTTPWAKNADGRGPAWSNSLFEDNAEFGLGMRLAADLQTDLAKVRLADLDGLLDAQLVGEILSAQQLYESDIRDQFDRIARLKDSLQPLLRHSEKAIRTHAKDLLYLADHLVRRSVWIVGGDGWAYDIGSGGVDHVLASGRDVNILVMDTEVYSNTGGQASKSTPIGAVAKFASAGKRTNKKDMALQAIAYGNVYVARVAMGADPQQTLRAFREAEAYAGPSLIIAYSHCIAHGFDLRQGLDQQYKAVASGHWPLMRYNPVTKWEGGNPFLLDSPRPRLQIKDYIDNELRYTMLRRTDPEEAARLGELAQRTAHQRWAEYEAMATRTAADFA